MATQASAITFLSTPGQAYEDGMRFVQFYFGLPLAMVLISAVFVPIYYRLQGLHRVRVPRAPLRPEDAAARRAFLFLIQRGLAAGITIYAPGDHPVEGARLVAGADQRRRWARWSSSTPSPAAPARSARRRSSRWW